MRPDLWITVKKAAVLAETPVRTMRRRLGYLDNKSGGKLLKWVSPRRVLVNCDALLRELRTDPEFREQELSKFHVKLDDHDKKLLALRDSLRALKKRVARIEKPIKTGQRL